MQFFFLLTQTADELREQEKNDEIQQKIAELEQTQVLTLQVGCVTLQQDHNIHDCGYIVQIVVINISADGPKIAKLYIWLY